jgi:hypothetical protein
MRWHVPVESALQRQGASPRLRDRKKVYPDTCARRSLPSLALSLLLDLARVRAHELPEQVPFDYTTVNDMVKGVPEEAVIDKVTKAANDMGARQLIRVDGSNSVMNYWSKKQWSWAPGHLLLRFRATRQSSILGNSELL